MFLNFCLLKFEQFQTMNDFRYLHPQVVALCLQKDPERRPTSAQLKEHRLFRHAKETSYIRR